MAEVLVEAPWSRVRAMTDERNQLELAGLGPPPRDVSPGLRVCLLTGPVVLIAAGIFDFSMAFVLTLGASAAPFTAWRLDLDHREAPGWLEAVEQTQFSEGGGDGDTGKPIRRYQYFFDLPNGQRVRGRSFAIDSPVLVQKAQPGPKNHPPDLVIEYAPGDPEINSIRGTRTGPYGSAVVIAALFPIITLLVVAGGICSGRRTIRLLRDGELASATMVACVMGGEDSVELPVAEYKRRMSLIPFPGMGIVLGVFQGFRTLWLLGAGGTLVFGLVFIAGALVFLAIAAMENAIALPMLVGVVGFGTVWIMIGSFMLRFAGGGLFNRRTPKRWQVQCVFEFTPPGGEPVRVRGIAPLNPDPVDEPPQPVIYDPENPKHAALLMTFPGLAVSPSGG